MIGLDTNVLVRILVRDDSNQAQAALDFINKNCNSNSPAYINSSVLCELVWVLESAYDYSKDEIVQAISLLLKTRNFVISEKENVRDALKLYKEHKIDFSDALIGYSNLSQGCEYNVTFDKKAAQTHLYQILV